MCQAGCWASLFLTAAPFLREPQISFPLRIAQLWRGAGRRLAHPTRLRSLYSRASSGLHVGLFPSKFGPTEQPAEGTASQISQPAGFTPSGCLLAAQSRREESQPRLYPRAALTTHGALGPCPTHGNSPGGVRSPPPPPGPLSPGAARRRPPAPLRRPPAPVA